MTPAVPEFCPKCGGPLVKEADRERWCPRCQPIVARCEPRKVIPAHEQYCDRTGGNGDEDCTCRF